MSDRSAADLVVELMRSTGTDVAFGVVSIHNMPLVDAVDHQARFVPVRHEASAVNAADGYSRATGRLGVAITSTGTGAGNAAGSLVEATSAGSRVLHITGQIPSEYLGRGRGVIHETKDQLGMLGAVSKGAFGITTRDEIGSQLAVAVACTLSVPNGPASVEWPIDLQYGPALTAWPVKVPLTVPTPPDQDAIDVAAELIRRARRRLLWLGGGAVHAKPEVAELIGRLGAGVFTSNSGRGTLPEDDPRCIGNFAANPVAGGLLAAADLLVSIGTHFRSNETRDYSLPLPRPHVQIDIDAAAFGSAYPSDVELLGDATEVLGVLLKALPADLPVDPEWSDEIGAARESVRQQLRSGLGAQAEICDVMRRLMPPETVVARDVTIPSSAWGNRLLDVYDHRSNVFPRGGGIGQGVAMGLGAASGRPNDPVVVMVGDGGLAVHLGELLTIVQEQPWVVIVLFNDRGYGVLRNMQDEYVGRRSGVDLHTPDFAALCSAVGLAHRAATTVPGFEAALRQALDRRGPSLIEVDVDALGPMPRPFIPPVPIP